MNSETSTEDVRLKPDATPDRSVRLQADQSLQPWQFFVLAGLGSATAATFIARGQGVVAVVLLALMMAGAAFVGLMALRTIQPLVSAEDDRTVMIGRRTRAALERDKLMALRAIKELEFDRAMGKVSEEDFREMSTRLRARATRLMRQLDAGAGYRQRIESDVEKKIATIGARSAKASDDWSAKASAERICAACETHNDGDAKFCKGCGQALAR
jgi:hypothetical protein